MLDLSFSSILPAALIGGLLCLSACPSKEDATDGDSTSEPATGGATESPTSTGTDATTPTTTEATTDPGTGTTDGSETAGACADHDLVDACCCFFVSDPGDGGPTPPTIEVGCGDQPLCPSFEILCGDPEDFMSSTPCSATTDDAALDCALAALAAGKSGSLQFELRHPMGGGFWGDTLQYYLRGDGTVFQFSRGYSDSASSAKVSHRTLKPAAIFSDCLGADSIEAKATCMQEATTDDVLEQCIDSDA
jgi:hypothetical protein